jgi:hypothetical protein
MMRQTLALLILTVPVVAARAQAPACTYDRCALRIEDQNPDFPARVVQGIEGRSVGMIGLFSSAIPLLATAPDSVRIPYEAFRTRQQLSSVFGALSLASLVAAPFFVHKGFGGPGNGVFYFMGASVVFGVTALATGTGAEGKLDEAIARYNDRLPDRR